MILGLSSPPLGVWWFIVRLPAVGGLLGLEDSCCGSSSLLCDMVWSSHSFLLRGLPSHLYCGNSSVLLDSCKCPEVVPV